MNTPDLDDSPPFDADRPRRVDVTLATHDAPPAAGPVDTSDDEPTAAASTAPSPGGQAQPPGAAAVADRAGRLPAVWRRPVDRGRLTAMDRHFLLRAAEIEIYKPAEPVSPALSLVRAEVARIADSVDQDVDDEDGDADGGRVGPAAGHDLAAADAEDADPSSDVPAGRPPQAARESDDLLRE